jgi:hypothetical protein
VGLRARRAHAGRVRHRLSHHRDRLLGAAREGLRVDVPHQGPRGVHDLGADHPDRSAVGDVRAQPAAPQRVHEDRDDRRERRDLGHAQRRLRARAQADPVVLERPHAQDEPPRDRRRVGQGRLVSEVVRPLGLPRVGPDPPRRDAAEGRAVQAHLQDARPRDRGRSRAGTGPRCCSTTPARRSASTPRSARPPCRASCPNFIRERHGIPPIDDKVYKPWIKSKKKTWDRRLEPPPTPTAKTSAKSTAKVATPARTSGPPRPAPAKSGT